MINYSIFVKMLSIAIQFDPTLKNPFTRHTSFSHQAGKLFRAGFPFFQIGAPVPWVKTQVSSFFEGFPREFPRAFRDGAVNHKFKLKHGETVRDE